MTEGILSLRNASIYQEGKLILKDINLDVQRGEFIYLIGNQEQEKVPY